ncbi:MULTISPECIES: hypothetical protein [unclassified Rhodococcus (in: high G+C Gram-positive bacteria)]|uniref:hypothetical protein n=1 Tax=unclassified Rhodococcus (in: high G+C Gram-positive bacteria) TaxID=192944 RepID=UPI00163A037C|nr:MULTISPECIES: hypothetical protein [unclassified Rhodococcus (in: high G+C Gram-positive bacteria)]MBC2637493.1 hypothetical protein [Rhodococcus sp. 3A]MBC2898415.1 hypothetical protein [Rhodococcus sp. 4CII]
MTTDIHRTHQTVRPDGAPVALDHAETGILETFVRALALQTITEAADGGEEDPRDTRR